MELNVTRKVEWSLRNGEICVLFFITATQVESTLEPDEIVNAIKEIVNLVRPVNLEMGSNDFQELLDSHN